MACLSSPIRGTLPPVRFANWIRLEDKQTGKELRIVNTHLDHVSQEAREKQAVVVNEETDAYPAEYPQILTGDMNCDANNRAMEILLENGWKDAHKEIHGTFTPGLTYHAFIGDDFEGAVDKIDFIFAKGILEITGAEIVKDSVDGRFPSDHYFVTADIEL